MSDVDGRDDLRRPQRDLTGMFDDHLGLVISATLATFVAARVLAVAAFSTETALALIASASTGSVLIGTLAPLLVVLPLLPGLAVIDRMFRAAVDATKVSPAQWRRWELVLVASVGVSLFLVPIWVMVVLLGAAFLLSVVLFLLFRLLDRGHKEASSSRLSRFVGIKYGEELFGAAVLFLAIVSSAAPWIPAESLQVGRHTEPITAFVISEDGEDLVVLRDDPRVVDRLPDGVFRRTYCARPDAGVGAWLFSEPPLGVWLLGGEVESGRYPDCP